MIRFAVVLLLLTLVVPGGATTWTVNLQSFTFSPTPVTVQLNDDVRWVWLDGSIPHSTTSDSGQLESWDSGVHTQAFNFQRTFTHTGSFKYYCSVHGAPGGVGMSGLVNVVPEPGALASFAGCVVGVFVRAVRRYRRK